MRGDSPVGCPNCSPEEQAKRKDRGGIRILLSPRQKRRLGHIMSKLRDAALARRYQIVLLRSRGWTYRLIAQSAGVSPGTVFRVLWRWESLRQAGLIDRREDNGLIKVDEEFLRMLWQVLEHPASHYRWPRPTWTIEMLARTLACKTGILVSRSTMSRALARIGARKGRPKPIVLCPWGKARRTRRLNQIRRLIEELPSRQVALWTDEVDVHLNPKIGPDWMLPRQQRQILTPGQNQKRYIAGALNAKTGRLTWVTGNRKTSLLFIDLLVQLAREYPRARAIHLILDNYRIHYSRQTAKVLESLGGRIRLHFLPPYSPDENRIERLWKDFHDNVTSNHRYKKMHWLMRSVEGYLIGRNWDASERPSRRKTA